MSEIESLRRAIKEGPSPTAKSVAGLTLYQGLCAIGMGFLLFILWPSMKSSYSPSSPYQIYWIQGGLIVGGLAVSVISFLAYRKYKDYESELERKLEHLSIDKLLDLVADEKSAQWVTGLIKGKWDRPGLGIVWLVARDSTRKEEILRVCTPVEPEIRKILAAAVKLSPGVMYPLPAKIALGSVSVGAACVFLPYLASASFYIAFGGVLFSFFLQGRLFNEARRELMQLSQEISSEMIGWIGNSIDPNRALTFKEILKKRAKNGDESAKKALKEFRSYYS